MYRTTGVYNMELAPASTAIVARAPSVEDALRQSEPEPANDSQDFYDDMMSSHQSLNRFMENLLEDAAVLPVQTLLVQDNASILTENASRSAHAINKKFSLGHDYLITKEISRWESYPFEVDTPIVVSKPKKIKNGCAPQRRAKRTGRESPGEIKASIKKQAESLPKAPRRRSSAATDSVKKSVVQEELISLFDSSMDDSNASNEGSRRAASPMRSAWPKRPESNTNHNPKAGLTPKMPVRRVSEIPEDLSPIYQPSSLASLSASTRPTGIHDHLSLNNGGSQHSSTSTESTLSEIVPRTPDGADVPAQKQSFTPLLESTSLECSMIEEEDDLREYNGPIPSSSTNNTTALSGRFQKKPPPTSTPKKPVRRVSEIPEDLGNEDVGSSSFHSTTSTSSSVIEKSAAISQSTSADGDSAPPPLADAVSKARSTDDSEEDWSIPKNNLPPATTANENKDGDDKDVSAIKRSSLPKKPVRRVSEIPEDLAHSGGKS